MRWLRKRLLKWLLRKDIARIQKLADHHREQAYEFNERHGEPADFCRGFSEGLLAAMKVIEVVPFNEKK